jgi:DNA repair photolyase
MTTRDDGSKGSRPPSGSAPRSERPKRIPRGTRPGRTPIKGRGAASNPEGRFEPLRRQPVDDGWGSLDEAPEPAPDTTLLPDATRTLITRNQSPDVGFDRSINPYKGCEHGCVYCFARPTHAYLDLSPGIDFETRIFFKTGVVERLNEELTASGYACRVLAMGTNTDPYQPAEKTLGITRQVLETLLDFRHPVSIVTKGTLIERDLDVLGELAQLDLASVMISVTTLDNQLKTTLEPRAASPQRRLELIRRLNGAGIPTGVLIAPVIPAVNDAELETLIERCADAGARSIGYVMLRLPYEVKDLFREWLEVHLPERAAHVMSVIRNMRGGQDYDPRWNHRQVGNGPFADLIRARFEIAVRKCGLDNATMPTLRTDLFRDPADRQVDLF